MLFVFNPDHAESCTYISVEGARLKRTLAKPLEDGQTKFPSVLLLHGASTAQGRGRVIFDRFQDVLAESGFASLAYDERGVGESTGEFCDATLANRLVAARCALMILSNLDYVDSNRLAVLGVSMGGHIAARLVGRNPDQMKVGALVLVNAAAYGPDAEDKRLKPFTEFTEAIRQPENWRNSLAFEDLAQFPGPVMVADSEFDDVIPDQVRQSYKRIIPNLDRQRILPGIRHAFLSAEDGRSEVARNILYQETVEFLNDVYCPAC